MHSDKAIKYLLEHHDFETLLDVGAGPGLQAAVFRDAGKVVRETDYKYDGDFLTVEGLGLHDVVWASHVLEHQPNVNLFLRRMIEHCNPGGLVVVTVPPAKHEIVGGHLTVWNAGLLIYNLILAGLDCSDAVVLKYGYNISAIARNRQEDLPVLNYDNGDIEKLERFFPRDWDVFQGFDGYAVGRGCG